MRACGSGALATAGRVVPGRVAATVSARRASVGGVSRCAVDRADHAPHVANNRNKPAAASTPTITPRGRLCAAKCAGPATGSAAPAVATTGMRALINAGASNFPPHATQITVSPASESGSSLTFWQAGHLTFIAA